MTLQVHNNYENGLKKWLEFQKEEGPKFLLFDLLYGLKQSCSKQDSLPSESTFNGWLDTTSGEGDVAAWTKYSRKRYNNHHTMAQALRRMKSWLTVWVSIKDPFEKKDQHKNQIWFREDEPKSSYDLKVFEPRTETNSWAALFRIKNYADQVRLLKRMMPKLEQSKQGSEILRILAHPERGAIDMRNVFNPPTSRPTEKVKKGKPPKTDETQRWVRTTSLIQPPGENTDPFVYPAGRKKKNGDQGIVDPTTDIGEMLREIACRLTPGVKDLIQSGNPDDRDAGLRMLGTLHASLYTDDLLKKSSGSQFQGDPRIIQKLSAGESPPVANIKALVKLMTGGWSYGNEIAAKTSIDANKLNTSTKWVGSVSIFTGALTLTTSLSTGKNVEVKEVFGSVQGAAGIGDGVKTFLEGRGLDPADLGNTNKLMRYLEYAGPITDVAGATLEIGEMLKSYADGRYVKAGAHSLAATGALAGFGVWMLGGSALVSGGISLGLALAAYLVMKFYVEPEHPIKDWVQGQYFGADYMETYPDGNFDYGRYFSGGTTKTHNRSQVQHHFYRQIGDYYKLLYPMSMKKKDTPSATLKNGSDKPTIRGANFNVNWAGKLVVPTVKAVRPGSRIVIQKEERGSELDGNPMPADRGHFVHEFTIPSPAPNKSSLPTQVTHENVVSNTQTGFRVNVSIDSNKADDRYDLKIYSGAKNRKHVWGHYKKEYNNPPKPVLVVRHLPPEIAEKVDSIREKTSLTLSQQRKVVRMAPSVTVEIDSPNGS